MSERSPSPPPIDLPKTIEQRDVICEVPPRSFLELSPSYSKAPHLRLGGIATELGNNFEFNGRSDKDVLLAVRKKLEAHGITISEQEYRVSKQLLMRVYQWLVAKGPTKERAYNNANTNEKNVINRFIKDGLTDWGQIDLSKLSFKKDEESIPGDPSEVETALDKANSHLWEQVGVLEKEKIELQNRIAELEARVTDLTEKLRKSTDAVRAPGESVEKATANAIVKENSLKESKKDSRERKLVESLPKGFKWENDKGGIEFTPQFVRAVLDLDPPDQQRVLAQIILFSTEGPRYPSLKTRSKALHVPFTPREAFVSRATDELRFTWGKNGGVKIYWVYKKGDSRVREKEA